MLTKRYRSSNEHITEYANEWCDLGFFGAGHTGNSDAHHGFYRHSTVHTKRWLLLIDFFNFGNKKPMSAINVFSTIAFYQLKTYYSFLLYKRTHFIAHTQVLWTIMHVENMTRINIILSYMQPISFECIYCKCKVHAGDIRRASLHALLNGCTVHACTLFILPKGNHKKNVR